MPQKKSIQIINTPFWPAIDKNQYLRHHYMFEEPCMNFCIHTEQFTPMLLSIWSNACAQRLGPGLYFLIPPPPPFPQSAAGYWHRHRSSPGRSWPLPTVHASSQPACLARSQCTLAAESETHNTWWYHYIQDRSLSAFSFFLTNRLLKICHQ